MPYNDNMPRVHAYTDQEGLTQFCIDFGYKRLLFAAYVTDFELNTEVQGVPLGLSDYSQLFTMGRRESRIHINAMVMEQTWETRGNVADTAPTMTSHSTPSVAGPATKMLPPANPSTDGKG